MTYIHYNTKLAIHLLSSLAYLELPGYFTKRHLNYFLRTLQNKFRDRAGRKKKGKSLGFDLVCLFQLAVKSEKKGFAGKSVT